MIQNISEPTRMRALDRTHILDLIKSNEDIVSIIQYLRPWGNSDHLTIIFAINEKVKYKKTFQNIIAIKVTTMQWTRTWVR